MPNTIGQAATRDGLFLKMQRRGFLARRVGDEFDGVVLAGPAALRLEPAQAFGQFLDPLFAAWFREPFDHLLQTRLEAFREALVHGGFLLGSCGGVAIQPYLRTGFIAPEL